MSYLNENLSIVTNLLSKSYDRCMYLKIYVDGNEQLKKKYINAVKEHNNKIKNNPTHIDSGFDLYLSSEDGKGMKFFGTGWSDREPVNKVNFRIKCSAQMYTSFGKIYNTGYYMYPRSSLSKTQLRLANSVGIIDAGYRGHIIGMFDVVNKQNNSDDRDCDYYVADNTRLVQICAPGLVPIVVDIVDSERDLGVMTERNTGGFGSTGV